MDPAVMLMVAALGGGTIVKLIDVSVSRRRAAVDVELSKAETADVMTQAAERLVLRAEAEIVALRTEAERISRMAETEITNLRSEIGALRGQVERLEGVVAWYAAQPGIEHPPRHSEDKP